MSLSGQTLGKIGAVNSARRRNGTVHRTLQDVKRRLAVALALQAVDHRVCEVCAQRRSAGDQDVE